MVMMMIMMMAHAMVTTLATLVMIEKHQAAI